MQETIIAIKVGVARAEASAIYERPTVKKIKLFQNSFEKVQLLTFSIGIVATVFMIRT